MRRNPHAARQPLPRWPLLSCRSFSALQQPAMIETNPIYARIADLRGRLDALRGYL
jgi:hypothetical protein